MKNRKAIAAIIILMMLPAAAFSATGLGAAFTYGLSHGDNHTGGALSINSPVIPGTVQNVSFSFNSDYFNFSLSDDWWVIQENLADTLDLYIGLGFYTGIARYEESDNDETDTTYDFGLGARVPVGLTMMPIDFAELFFEIAPAMGTGIRAGTVFPLLVCAGGVRIPSLVLGRVPSNPHRSSGRICIPFP